MRDRWFRLPCECCESVSHRKSSRAGPQRRAQSQRLLGAGSAMPTGRTTTLSRGVARRPRQGHASSSDVITGRPKISEASRHTQMRAHSRLQGPQWSICTVAEGATPVHQARQRPRLFRRGWLRRRGRMSPVAAPRRRSASRLRARRSEARRGRCGDARGSAGRPAGAAIPPPGRAPRGLQPRRPSPAEPPDSTCTNSCRRRSSAGSVNASDRTRPRLLERSRDD